MDNPFDNYFSPAREHARKFLERFPEVFYSAHCTRGCTIAGWSRNPVKILAVLLMPCPTCGSLLTQHCVPK